MSSSRTILRGFEGRSGLEEDAVEDFSSDFGAKNDFTVGVLLLLLVVLSGTRGGGAMLFGSSQYAVENGSIDFSFGSVQISTSISVESRVTYRS